MGYFALLGGVDYDWSLMCWPVNIESGGRIGKYYDDEVKKELSEYCLHDEKGKLLVIGR